MSTNKEKVSWLTGILTGWGIKESWAKIIAGAIIGALLAAGAFANSSCTHAELTPEQVQQVYKVQRGAEAMNILLQDAVRVANGEQSRIFIVEDYQK